jgi:hypothetical protein
VASNAALLRLGEAVDRLERLVERLPATMATADDLRLREDYSALLASHSLLRSRAEVALAEVDRLLAHDREAG